MLLLINCCTSWFLAGLIWFVQIVHYPLLGNVGSDAFGGYHRKHVRFVTWLVAGPMTLEALAAIGLLVWRPAAVSVAAAITGLVLVGLIWASTAFLQVPKHDALAKGLNVDACRALVVGNWIRTIAWTARAVLITYLVATVLRQANADR